MTALAQFTAPEEEYEMIMDLVCRHVAWAENRHSLKRIRADTMATLQEIHWNDNPIAFAFYFAAYSYVDGQFWTP